MNYLGYCIHIRGCVWHGDGIGAEITSTSGEHVLIIDSDRFSAESTAREIVDYATCHDVSLDAASQRVLH